MRRADAGRQPVAAVMTGRAAASQMTRPSVTAGAELRTPVTDDGLLTHGEAAQYLRVSPSWLYQSDIPFVRIGTRGRRYDRRELRQYIETHLTHSLIVSEP